MKHRTEVVYDSEMAPLVARLIEIAKRERIPLLVSAGMINERGGRMTCDTLVADTDAPTGPGIVNRYALCKELIRGHEGFDTAAGLWITRHHPTEEGTP